GASGTARRGRSSPSPRTGSWRSRVHIIASQYYCRKVNQRKVAQQSQATEVAGCAERLGKVEPLLPIPTFVLDFLCIHPFADGNGRMARLLTLLLLYQHGFGVGRYVSL